jgi:hypothetical protein
MSEIAADPKAPRWIPMATALLALLAAVSGLLGNLRVTQANMAKSDAIIATTHAADTYNEYESRSIKEHIYEAAVAAGTTRDPKPLQLIAQHEASGKGPLLSKARAFEDAAQRFTERSGHILASHEILEVATTLFEIAIVLISVAALVGSRLLPITAGLAGLAGALVGVYGFAY